MFPSLFRRLAHLLGDRPLDFLHHKAALVVGCAVSVVLFHNGPAIIVMASVVVPVALFLGELSRHKALLGMLSQDDTLPIVRQSGLPDDIALIAAYGGGASDDPNGGMDCTDPEYPSRIAIYCLSENGAEV